MDEIQINITIMEKAYRITVARADEEKVRKAVSMINEMVKSYARHYTFKDVQDVLAMTALHFATSAVQFIQLAFQMLIFKGRLRLIFHRGSGKLQCGHRQQILHILEVVMP